MKRIYLFSIMSFLSTLAVPTMHAMGHDTSSGITLQTEGGVADEKSCALYKEYAQGVPVGEYIECKDGTRFDSPVELKGSATATQPHIRYSNYIGSYLKQEKLGTIPLMRLPSEGELVMYFDGDPQQR